MDPKKRKVYLSLISIFLFFYILVAIYLSIIPQDPSSEGQFIIPGNERFEQLFSILIAPVSSMLSGIISIFFSTRVFIKTYAKSLRKYQKVGLAPLEELSGFLLWRKLIIRAMYLAFFTINISYTLASQEILVNFMRSVDPDRIHLMPDPLTMWMLAWIVMIPCTFILVPIWLTMDSGVVAAKKVEGVNFTSANLVSGASNRIIKGFVTIGFIYNLSITLFFWAMYNYLSGDPGAEFDLIFNIISPLIAISFSIPVIILIDYQKDRFRTKLEKHLIQLDMYKELICSYELKDINSKS